MSSMSEKKSYLQSFTSFFSCKEYTKYCCKKEVTSLTFSEKLAHRFHHLICYTCRRFSKQISSLNCACKYITTEGSLGEKKLSEETKKKISEKLKDL
jgi:Cdc6-like AAA superfamily ATPase